MLTRLEVDGFKNLVDLAVDFGPFTCIAGANGVGKSNLFDAIRFLSLLADHTLVEAALRVRDSDKENNDLADLFQRRAGGVPRPIKIAAEMLINRDVLDDFGRSAQANSTFLRYEVEIGYAPPSQIGSLGRLELLTERLQYITKGDSAQHLRFPHSAAQFRAAVVINERRTSAGYISTNRGEDGVTEIMVHQDGGSRGLGQVAPARTAPRTIVGTSNTSTTPTILAARREMQSWKFLALEPSAMRLPDRFQSDQYVTASGGHLPATLFRLANRERERGNDPEDLYARIANRLAKLIAVKSLRVDVDQVRQILTLQAQENDGQFYSASSLSDGTLRFLTLAILVEDPESQGMICMEEPENGIHPAKIEAISALLHDLAVDTSQSPSDENPLRQVIVATHSPSFVQIQDPHNLLFAQQAKLRDEQGGIAHSLRCLPLDGTWRVRDGELSVGKATIIDYLVYPPNAQIALPGMLPQEHGR